VATRFLVLLEMTAFLAACASTKDVHLERVEPACGHSCAVEYQECTNRPGYLFFPIEVQRQCVSALKLCAQACPAR
jgi:hypothetical protein